MNRFDKIKIAKSLIHTAGLLLKHAGTPLPATAKGLPKLQDFMLDSVYDECLENYGKKAMGKSPSDFYLKLTSGWKTPNRNNGEEEVMPPSAITDLEDLTQHLANLLTAEFWIAEESKLTHDELVTILKARSSSFGGKAVPEDKSELNSMIAQGGCSPRYCRVLTKVKNTMGW
jgi:hypothetical protein